MIIFYYFCINVNSSLLLYKQLFKFISICFIFLISCEQNFSINNQKNKVKFQSCEIAENYKIYKNYLQNTNIIKYKPGANQRLILNNKEINMQTPHPVQSPYEGPHPQIDKILHMHNCYTKTSNQYKIKVEYIAGTRQINISRALQQVHSQGLKIQNSQVFFENLDLKMYMYLGTFPFHNNVYLKYQYCLDPIIKLKYKKISQSPKSTPNPPSQYSKSSQPQVQTTKAPKSRPKQRTVGQVLQTVKNWKQLIAQLDHTGHKIHTLTSAAEVIGICKKTLEDYAHQVQFGYQFNFDFQKNMHQKIGFLRKFVKAKRKELAILNNTDNYWNFQASNSNSSDDDKGNAR